MKTLLSIIFCFLLVGTIAISKINKNINRTIIFKKNNVSFISLNNGKKWNYLLKNNIQYKKKTIQYVFIYIKTHSAYITFNNGRNWSLFNEHNNNKEYNLLNNTLYPNPANNILNIRLSSFSNKNINIKIFDILGNQKANLYLNNFNNDIYLLNIVHFTKGKYFLTIRDEKNHYTYSFIKN